MVEAVSNFVRLVRTASYLKPVQIYGRLRFRYGRVGINLKQMPQRRPVLDAWTTAARSHRCLLAPGVFRFLNETGHVKCAEDWNSPNQKKLWLYNLHYFDWLKSALTDQQRRYCKAVIKRWIDDNPVGYGNGWEPYPMSLRIVNWCKWSLGGETLEADALESLAKQANWLEQKIEWHLLGNHLLANAKALTFAGLMFEGDDADRWLATGLSIYEDQLDEQVLADGGHFERSPMYHGIILEDLLDVLNLSRAYGYSSHRVLDRIEARMPAMLEWLNAMTHPDGEISFFNDAAIGIAPEPKALFEYAERLGFAQPEPLGDGVIRLAESGYLRVDYAGATVIIDLAPVGPDYLPGHAHADTLSFEMSIGGKRVFVNAGTSIYAPGELREFQRSTAAHNTVELDGFDSSEVWSSFRVARRAYVHDVQIEEREDGVQISASHDGYKRLAGAPRHRRTWQFVNQTLVIGDTIDGAGSHPATARLLLSPQAQCNPAAAGADVELDIEGTNVRVEANRPINVGAANWYPEFGRCESTHCLEVNLTDNSVETRIIW